MLYPEALSTAWTVRAIGLILAGASFGRLPMTMLLDDLRYGCLMLMKDPGFTASAVLTLALGIGANTTSFSWISSTLLNPVPGVAHTSDCVAFTRGAG